MTRKIPESTKRLMLDFIVRQSAGERLPCPRCGRDTMNPVLNLNSPSLEQVGLYVCAECHEHEVSIAYMNNPAPLFFWAAFREDKLNDSFADTDTDEALRTIEYEYVPELKRAYDRFYDHIVDAWTARIEACRACPGAKEISEPNTLGMEARFTVPDGEILVRIKRRRGETMFAIGVIDPKAERDESNAVIVPFNTEE